MTCTWIELYKHRDYFPSLELLLKKPYTTIYYLKSDTTKSRFKCISNSRTIYLLETSRKFETCFTIPHLAEDYYYLNRYSGSMFSGISGFTAFNNGVLNTIHSYTTSEYLEYLNKVAESLGCL